MASPEIKVGLIQNITGNVTLDDGYLGCCDASVAETLTSIGETWNRSQPFNSTDEGYLYIVCECFYISGDDQYLDFSAAHVIGGEAGALLSATEDVTGTTPIYVTLNTPSTNTAAVEITYPATQGYPLLGLENLLGAYYQPDSLMFLDRIQNPLPAITSAQKRVKVSGTSGDQVTIAVIVRSDCFMLIEGGYFNLIGP